MSFSQDSVRRWVQKAWIFNHELICGLLKINPQVEFKVRGSSQFISNLTEISISCRILANQDHKTKIL